MTTQLELQALQAASRYEPAIREMISKKLDTDSVFDRLNQALLPPDIALKIFTRTMRGAFNLYMEASTSPALDSPGIQLLAKHGVKPPAPHDFSKEIQPLHKKLMKYHTAAWTKQYGTPPRMPLGYYGVWSDNKWIEIVNLETATNPEILAMRQGHSQPTTYF